MEENYTNDNSRGYVRTPTRDKGGGGEQYYNSVGSWYSQAEYQDGHPTQSPIVTK